MARRLGFLMVTLGLLLHWSQASYEYYCGFRAPSEPRRGICGSTLADVVDIVCGRRPFGEARENISQRKKRGSMASLLKTRAKRAIRSQGIICECCVNQCSYEEFREYC